MDSDTGTESGIWMNGSGNWMKRSSAPSSSVSSMFGLETTESEDECERVGVECGERSSCRLTKKLLYSMLDMAVRRHSLRGVPGTRIESN